MRKFQFSLLGLLAVYISVNAIDHPSQGYNTNRITQWNNTSIPSDQYDTTRRGEWNNVNRTPYYQYDTTRTEPWGSVARNPYNLYDAYRLPQWNNLSSSYSSPYDTKIDSQWTNANGVGTNQWNYATGGAANPYDVYPDEDWSGEAGSLGSSRNYSSGQATNPYNTQANNTPGTPSERYYSSGALRHYSYDPYRSSQWDTGYGYFANPRNYTSGAVTSPNWGYNPQYYGRGGYPSYQWTDPRFSPWNDPRYYGGYYPNYTRYPGRYDIVPNAPFGYGGYADYYNNYYYYPGDYPPRYVFDPYGRGYPP